jgi:hypothetical protein
MKKLIAVMLCLFSAVDVYAVGAALGNLQFPTIQAGGQVLVAPDQSLGPSKPACNTANRFAFDSTTAVGKSRLGMVLSAIAMGRTVTIVGTGFCTLWGDSEDLSYFTIN